MGRVSVILTLYLLFLCTSVLAQTTLASGLYNKGYQLVNQQQYLKAIPYLEEAVSQSPEYSKAWLQLGYCYFNSNQATKAFTAYQHAITLEPDFAQAYLYTGNAHLRRAEYDDAIQSFGRATTLKSDYTEAYYGAGIAYLAKGDRESAKKQFLLLDVINAQDNLKGQYKEILDFTSKPSQYYIGDKGPLNPSFAAFRARFLQSVRRHDAPSFLSMVSPTVHNGDDGPNSIVAFKKEWRPYSPNSELWSEMESALSFGGTWPTFGRGKIFMVPYESGNDSSWSMLSGKAVVHTLPSNSSQVVGTFSHDVVIKLDGPFSSSSDWTWIMMSGGKTGYVTDQEIAPETLFARFEQIKGRWFLSSFGHGT